MARQLATVPEDAFELRQELRDVEAQKEVAVRMQARKFRVLGGFGLLAYVFWGWIC